MYPRIDFGTSDSKASYSDGAHICSDDDSTTGHPVIQSAVLLAAQGEVLVGNKATYCQVGELQVYHEQIKHHPGEDTRLHLAGQYFRAGELIACILGKIKNDNYLLHTTT